MKPGTNLPNDAVVIEELEVEGRVGVTDEERAQPQRLTISLTLQAPSGFADLGDDLARTVDYAVVCEEVRHFVAGRQDKLIETLAHELAEHLRKRFALPRIELELRKFILPETRYVAVRLTRTA
ncbi:MAG TPA: dihydroneopterin aldolase [Chthoniobacterales bacterium]|jgi:dihydroneopterin aldolase